MNKNNDTQLCVIKVGDMDLVLTHEEVQTLWLDYEDLNKRYKELVTRMLEAEKVSQAVVESTSAHCVVETDKECS